MKLRLSDIYELQMGKTPARNTPAFWNGTNAWVSISDLTSSRKYISQTRECITDNAITRTGIKKIPKDTLLMSFKLSLGKVAITTTDIYTNEAIMAFIDKKKYDVDIHYMYHYFQAIDWTIGTNKAVKGITLNKRALSEKVVDLPPINIQQEIAERMDNLNAVTENLQRQFMLLDELVKSQFVELFGDVKYNSKQWASIKLDHIAEVGSSKRVFAEELQPVGIPFYRGTEIGALAEGKNITPELHITEDHYIQLCRASGTPQRGDLLMPSICDDGRIWLVDTDEPFYFKDGRVLWVHLTNKGFNNIFLQYVMKSKITTDYEHIASGTTFKELKIFSLKSLDIIQPPLSLQNKFAAFVEQVDKSKLVLRQLLEKQKTLKAALMQEYFS